MVLLQTFTKLGRISWLNMLNQHIPPFRFTTKSLQSSSWVQFKSMQAPGAKLIVASLHAPCPPGPDHFEIQIATFFLGFIHVYPQILSAPFQNEYCHYIPLHLIIYIPTNIPFHPTNHYIPLHRGKHPMTHGVSPFPAPFPLLLLYLQPRNHIRKRSRNFH